MALVAFFFGTHYYGDGTRGLSDKTLKCGPMYRCFTQGTSKSLDGSVDKKSPAMY